jgi:hypothetical protein
MSVAFCMSAMTGYDWLCLAAMSGAYVWLHWLCKAMTGCVWLYGYVSYLCASCMAQAYDPQKVNCI